MGILRFVTHPQVRISADIPVPLWGLSDVGRTRAYQLSTQPWLATTTRLISSAETKALETATGDLLTNRRGDILVIAHGAVGTLLLCDLLGIAISRSEDQVGGEAAPGGGNYWSFDQQTKTIRHRWKSIDT
jgi:broad specificity phosphatase PhoE